MLVLVMGFSYIPGAIFSEKFLLQSSCCFGLVRIFLLIFSLPHVMFSEEFQLHS